MLRVALCNDFPEEQWPSMDRVANELVTEVGRRSADVVEIVPVCPPFARRATRVTGPGPGAAFTIDRALNRWWDYPRHVASIASRFDCFHVIDHSYAQLVHHLPASRTVVTCHDLDTFRSVLRPEDDHRSPVFRMATRRILTGLQKAAWVTFDTATVRDEMIGFGLLASDRASVVPVGVSDGFAPEADAAADQVAARLVGTKPDAVELLHVGSTIARKRIDVLLQVYAALVVSVPGVHLVRVGGSFTRDQQRLLERLGLVDRITTVDFVNERTLAALYRRAALVLQPSEREGFGLPLLESMACGTPVVASDLPVLKEVGGRAADYCRLGDTAVWVRVVRALLEERRRDPHRWEERRQTAIARARCFSWSQFASRMTEIYQTIFHARRGRSEARDSGLHAEAHP